MKTKLIMRFMPYTLAIVLVGSMIFATDAYAISNGDDDGVSAVSSVNIGGNSNISNGNDDSNGSGGESVGDGTVNGDVSNGNDDNIFNADNDDGPGTVNGKVTNGDDDISGSVINDPDGDNDTPGDNGGRRNRGGSRRTQSRLPVASPLTLTAGELDLGPVAIGSCSIYLTQYVKQGGNNNPAEVRKLQLFLKNSEKLDVDITDVFDSKTFEAVKAFQAKYVIDTMGPWGATIPSGQVYISTTKKINELYCNNPLTFTAQDLAIFAAYRNQKVSVPFVVVSTTADISIEEDANASTTILNEDGQEIDGSSNTAAASLGLRSRIGNFFSGIFNFFFGK